MHMFSHRFNRTGIRTRFSPRTDRIRHQLSSRRSGIITFTKNGDITGNAPNQLAETLCTIAILLANTFRATLHPAMPGPPVNIGKQYTIRPVPVNIATGTGTAFTRIDDPLLSTLSDMKNLSSKKSSQLTQWIISDTLTCQPDIPGFDLP